MIRTSCSFVRRRLATAASTLLLLGAPALQGQTPEAPDPEPVQNPRRGFSLFGLADFAITGMRSAGNSTWFTTNAGPGNTFNFYSAGVARTRGTARSPTGFVGGWFEIQLWMAAARGDWVRFRDIAPSLEAVKGGGWSARMNFQRQQAEQFLAFQGRDGSVGTLYSGVTSEVGTGTCRDNSNRPNTLVSAGVPLLAGSDCPPTWAGSTFAGEHPVPDTVWLRRFTADPANFTFDDWKVPLTERAAKLYGSFQTFGSSVDYGRETKERFGSVIPGQSGAPDLEGYPLGIEWEFQAWTYGVPAVADAMFYQARVINNSKLVYGVGLDYDSLYLGFMPRPFHTGGTQAPTLYAVPEKGLMFEANNNINNTNCYAAVHGAGAGGYTAGTNIRGCISGTDPDRGFRAGGGAVMILKSPIGDLRNKKFTDPASPFYFPTHANKGDTLTFNIADACGFTCSNSQFVPGVHRAAFGAYAEQEVHALGGRNATSGDLTQTQYFDLFHTQDWPTRWSPSNPTVGGFNKYVPPGGWDYDKDGVLDTLALTTCGRNGCVKAWSDTLIGGFPNNLHNMYHIGVGPIKLKADDTTSFIVAFVATPDSISLESTVNNVLQVYQNFWLSAEPPCPTNIVSAIPTGGNRQFDTFVRLFFDESVNSCQDVFLLEAAKNLKSSLAPRDLRLRVLNPTLVVDILARALPAGTPLVDTVPLTSDAATATACASPATFTTSKCRIVTATALGVVDTLFVFKSCDAGTSFTNSSAASCPPAPARDVSGAAPRFPWQAYARIPRGPTGKFLTTFSDGGVTGGLSYIYVLVGQSFPAVFSVLDSIGGTVQQTTYTVRPLTQNGISINSSDRNVATVYVPASDQAGSSGATVFFMGTTGDTTAAYAVTASLTKPVRGSAPLSAALITSDSAEVEVYDADTSTSQISRTTLRLYALADTGFAAVKRAAVQQRVFTLDSTSRLDVVGPFVRKDSIVGTEKWTFFRFAGSGLQGTLVVDGKPLYITGTVTSGDITPPPTLIRSDFPGLAIGLDAAKQRTFSHNAWFQPGIGVLQVEAYPTITWRSAVSVSRDPTAFSHYRITFGGPEFGPGAPFTIDVANVPAVDAAYTASLNARVASSNTDVSATSAAALSRALRRTITVDSLAQLALPFTVSNARLGKPVTIAVLKSEHPRTALLGNGPDTVRVNVPADNWVPGDRLYFVETFDTFKTDTSMAGKERVLLTGGQTTNVSVTRVTWGPGRLECEGVPTCNPVIGIGGTGYTQTNPNQQLEVVYFGPLGRLLELAFQVNPEIAGPQVATVTRADLSRVRAVPNPYVMFSQYEQIRDTKRLMFTHLPAKGSIRIYTASGQFVQMLTWTDADLEKNCSATVATVDCQSTGDLFWDMRSRENLEIGPGFYVFVVRSDTGAEKIGKFVVIH